MYVCTYVCSSLDRVFAFGCASELQQFMITYEKFMKWLEATLDAAVTRSETKHSVGVTECKLEEHKVNMYSHRAHNNKYWLVVFQTGNITIDYH